MKIDFKLFVRKKMVRYFVLLMMDSMDEMPLISWQELCMRTLYFTSICWNRVVNRSRPWLQVIQILMVPFIENLGTLILEESQMITTRDLFGQKVRESLPRALTQAENDFLYMVEQEMNDRPDLVSVGSCVLIVLLYDKTLYTISLGDSRAVLATREEGISD